MFTDSHCHLSFPDLQAKLPEIRSAMQAAKVNRALCVCTTLEEFEIVHQLAAAASKIGGGVTAIDDDALLDEVTALV